MLLRIEDTDRERSTQAAIDAILDGLSWLGIEWDGDAIYQFARAARHREIAEQLLASGSAYHCYATPEELTQMREAARAEGRSKLYNGLWRDRDPGEAPTGARPTIRLKAPLTGETVVDDQVQGRVVWQNENLDDLVLLRSDGTPTYMLAVVVDDHDMDVTHIIRGDDHLTNAARQTQIYQALGWPVPVMAHIPLIHGPDGSKLSKRHGALGVDAYRRRQDPARAHQTEHVCHGRRVAHSRQSRDHRRDRRERSRRHAFRSSGRAVCGRRFTQDSEQTQVAGEAYARMARRRLAQRRAMQVRRVEHAQQDGARVLRFEPSLGTGSTVLALFRRRQDRAAA
jgi:glutamyl/glutaminyl-tRNA synthetase